jgi:hypothetical protein
MGFLKFLMLAAGVAIMATAALMDTSVGGNRFGERVHNLSKAQNQTVLLIVGGVVFLAGVMIRRREAKVDDDLRKCPFCAEDIQRAARKCKHCGESVEPVESASSAITTAEPDLRADEAERLGASRDGRFWVFDGHLFASAGEVIAFASQRKT